MDTEGRDEILREIITALAICGDRYGRKTAETREWRILQELWLNRDQLHDGLPESFPDGVHGYLVDQGSIWWSRTAAESLGLGEGGADLCHDGDTFHKRLAKSWEAVSQLGQPQSSLLVDTIRSRELLDALGEFGVTGDRLVSSTCVLVCGVEQGISWLGCRDGSDVAKELLKQTAAARAQRLHKQGSSLRVDRFPEVERSSWWEHTTTTPQDITKVLVPCCRHIMAALGKLTKAGDNLDILTDPTIKLPARAVITYAPTLTPHIAMGLLASALPVLQREQSPTLVVCTTASFDEATTILCDPRVVTHGYSKRRVLIADPVVIAEYLSTMPRVWSEYCGGSVGVQYLRNDAERLASTVLVGRHHEPLPRNVRRVHLVVEDQPLKNSERRCVIGPPASGVTTALHHVLEQTITERSVIVLHWWSPARAYAIAHAMIGESKDSIVVAIDSVDRCNEHAIEALARIHGAFPTIAMLLGAREAPTLKMPRTAALLADFHTVSLRRPSMESVGTVLVEELGDAWTNMGLLCYSAPFWLIAVTTDELPVGLLVKLARAIRAENDALPKHEYTRLGRAIAVLRLYQDAITGIIGFDHRTVNQETPREQDFGASDDQRVFWGHRGLGLATRGQERAELRLWRSRWSHLQRDHDRLRVLVQILSVLYRCYQQCISTSVIAYFAGRMLGLDHSEVEQSLRALATPLHRSWIWRTEHLIGLNPVAFEALPPTMLVNDGKVTALWRSVIRLTVEARDETLGGVRSEFLRGLAYGLLIEEAYGCAADVLHRGVLGYQGLASAERVHCIGVMISSWRLTNELVPMMGCLVHLAYGASDPARVLVDIVSVLRPGIIAGVFQPIDSIPTRLMKHRRTLRNRLWDLEHVRPSGREWAIFKYAIDHTFTTSANQVWLRCVDLLLQYERVRQARAVLYHLRTRMLTTEEQDEYRAVHERCQHAFQRSRVGLACEWPRISIFGNHGDREPTVDWARFTRREQTQQHEDPESDAACSPFVERP